MTSRFRRYSSLLGPAFVASVAYADPGNFAANFSAGSQYGYLLLWVLVVSNVMAMVVQYLSAKVGIATGQSLPEIIGKRLGTRARFLYWVQAELVAMATDIAEVIGGAIALQLLFGVPLIAGGVITGVISLLLLTLYNRREQKYFERIIFGLLLILPIGFFAGIALRPPELSEFSAGLVPRLAGPDTVLLAAAMLGATVMPHVVYLHSSLTRDRYKGMTLRPASLLKATRIDIVIAMVFAGAINVSMLILAATSLRGVNGDSLEIIYQALGANVNGTIATLFAVGLLISGFASTAVGSQAGAAIMAGLYDRHVSLLARRIITVIPALIVLTIGSNPTHVLIYSQVALSLGIPFALIPLILITSSKNNMKELVNTRILTILSSAIVGIIIILNGYFLLSR